MRVVIAAGIFPPDIGGPATYASNLAKHLVNVGHKVNVISYGQNFSKYESDGYSITTISRNVNKITSFFLYLIKLYRLTSNTDVIYAQGPSVGGIQSLLLFKLLRRPYIVKITGDYAWERARLANDYNASIDDFQNTNRNIPIKIQILKSIQRLVARNAVKVIVPSNYLSSIVKGWDSSIQPTVIYNAVEKFNSSKKYSFNYSNNVVLSVGRLVSWKGFENLIKLWPKVIKSIPDAQLIIVGSGPLEENLKSLVLKMKLKDYVKLVGKKDPDELSFLYQKSSAFVLNSEYEGLSHTIIEALQNDLPVIASDIKGNRELIENNVNGILVKYSDSGELSKSIIKILEDKSYAEGLVTSAKKGLDKFRTDHMLESTEKILKQLVKN